VSAPPELVVMAAGVGSRYGGLKQVEPVGPGGEFVMDYAVYDAARAGVERAVFVIRREMEADFHALRGSRYARLLDVAYAFQELDCVPPGFTAPSERRKPWGTGHAVLVAREQVTAPFIAINADDFYGAAGFRALVNFLGNGKELGRGEAGDPGSGRLEDAGETERYALVAYELEKTLSVHGGVARGICEVGRDGTLRAIAEHTSVERENHGIRGVAPDGAVRRFTGSEPVSMNLWGFRPGLFAHLEERFGRFLAERGGDPQAELYLPAVVDELIREGQASVRVLRTAEPWFGVTYKEDRAAVAARIRELVARGDYPARLWD
jgi:dTDP-glucose pyrophosphorylase